MMHQCSREAVGQDALAHLEGLSTQGPDVTGRGWPIANIAHEFTDAVAQGGHFLARAGQRRRVVRTGVPPFG
jgi:hypothetical protein